MRLADPTTSLSEVPSMAKARTPSRCYAAVHDPEGRRQQIALFGASLSKLRKELNRWWDATGGGLEPCQGPQLLAVRELVREAAEEERLIKR